MAYVLPVEQPAGAFLMNGALDLGELNGFDESFPAGSRMLTLQARRPVWDMAFTISLKLWQNTRAGTLSRS